MRPLKLYLPFGILGLCLALLAWSAQRLIRQPALGMDWANDGTITRLSSAAVGYAQNGERLLSVDGKPISQTPQTLDTKQVGEMVALTLERDGVRRSVRLPLAPPSLGEALIRLGPIITALAFWLLGVVVWAYKPAEDASPRTRLFFLFSQVTAALFCAYALASSGVAGGTGVLAILIWWSGAVSTHFHLHFPSAGVRLSRRGLAALYTLTFVGSLTSFVVGFVILPAFLSWFRWVIIAWAVGHWLFVVVWLTRVYRRTASVEARRQIGVVALGSGVAFATLTTLFLIPALIFRQPLFPIRIAFTLLLIIPAAYGYAVLRYRLIRLDRYVSQGATLALTVALLAGAYFSLNAVLNAFFPQPPLGQPLAGLITAFGVALAVGPLFRRVRPFVNRLLYGGWYDYRSAIRQVSRVIDPRIERSTLAQTLTQELRSAMQLEHVCLLAADDVHNPQSMVQHACECAPSAASTARVEASSPLHGCFVNAPQPVLAAQLRRTLDGAALNPLETELLRCPRVRLWLPLPGRDRPMGYLLLGAKRGGGLFDANDLEILEVVARQMGAALQNAQLIAELQLRAQESAQLHQEIVQAREEERKRVARELHDQIIQSLIGLNYQLAEVRSHADGEDWPTRLQGEVRQMVNEVRRICSDLRPPSLDTLGLAAAVRARVREAEAQAPFRIHVNVEGDEEQELPEDVALCLYRVLQEALFNIHKHAAAKQVEVYLRLTPEEVRLSVEDDGRGFLVRRRLSRAADTGHIGLLGLRERLKVVHGTLRINSFPGLGTRLEARVPLAASVGRKQGAGER